MKTQSSMLHVWTDTEMKRKATTALAAMGLTPSEAVRLLLPSHRGRSGLPARTQGAERANPQGHGRGGRDVCGT